MELYGKKTASEKLNYFLKSGRIPHAVMITGAEGAGKRTLADYIAMLMLCEKKGMTPCGACNECMRISEHIHPDVIYPLKESDNGKYNIKNLVELTNNCYKLPNDADMRICIFENADTMNISCQNALLKFIEEPLRFNRFIFTVTDKKLILDTIISRVTEIPADLPTPEECSAFLRLQGIEADEAAELSRTFGGNIGRCLKAHSGEGESLLLKLSEEIACAVCEGREYDCMVRFAGIKNREDMVTVLHNLSDIFGNAMASAVKGKTYGFVPSASEKIANENSIKKINVLYETVGGLIRSLDFNPNVQLIAAVCCAKMFDAAENR